MYETWAAYLGIWLVVGLAALGVRWLWKRDESCDNIGSVFATVGVVILVIFGFWLWVLFGLLPIQALLQP
jgi:hypothetical protein